ncbi:MAG TPA: tripartite tricarboxylate transporter substrate binding protein [Ramlibacter sp.]|uniref:Bug family tripartite tricarboxylate transporter substrate binding protein n=1 Tax=Ramlibacter sp. TaxID=1917967 RepID=UPI002CEA096D|nr:tripartite tricarboxylate transporter substrate binding protein [Ramlibacter sp.]HVZ45908.1 tripartite tricarboxylate transporter substrate binding protein [Ramlibacter sp.]
MTPMHSYRRRAVCAAILACAATSAFAWADKPVKLVVPAPPGGVMDVMARVVGEQLAKDIGQNVIVENKPGAGGGIGMSAVLNAPADGNTLMVTASNVLTEIPHVMKTAFDPLKDVKPVYAVARVRNLLVSGTAVPAQDFRQLVAYLKAGPGKYSYASHSPGTASHYAGLFLNNDYGLDLQHVPFAGAPPALTQVMSGQITVLFDNVITSPPMIAAGKLRAYGIGGSTRNPALPNVPTFIELGRPDLDYTNWFGFVASAKVSDADVERIARAVQKAAEVPAVRERLVGLGFEIMPPQTPAAFAQSVRAEYARNAAIVTKFNVQP